MLNDIFPNIFNNKYLPDYQMSKNDCLLYYRDNHVLLKRSGDDYVIPVKGDFSESDESIIYLFSINSTHFFGATKTPVYNDSFEYQDVFSLRNIIDKKYAWLASVGYQLMTWYVQNMYCGRCGSETELKKDERAIVCTKCNHIIFPKISPAIIVAITCNNKILLIKGKNYRIKFFTLVAGYVDVGESIEETVAREVKEEVGLEIKNVRYFKSQPWPYSSSLMMGFTAETDENQQIIIDENEVEEAAWFARDNLPERMKGVSISGELIDAFENGEF